jgi:hypothetical protein
LGTSSKSPSTPTESSSSEEESSSESEYEEDEEMPVQDISEVSLNILARVPLPVTWAKTSIYNVGLRVDIQSTAILDKTSWRM